MNFNSTCVPVEEVAIACEASVHALGTPSRNIQVSE
jgi:hypothetical protein